MDKESEIIRVLNKIRPYLQMDGGDVEFVSFKDGIVYVKIRGACIGCVILDTTLKEGIEALLVEEVEGVIGVEIYDEDTDA